MSIAKANFEKHQFLYDYAEKSSEFFYEQIKAQSSSDKSKHAEKASEFQSMFDKSELNKYYVLSLSVFSEKVLVTIPVNKGLCSLALSICGPSLDFVNEYNMRPIEDWEDQQTLKMFLAELIVKKLKEKLCENPIDLKYDISLEGDNIIYSAQNSAYSATIEW